RPFLWNVITDERVILQLDEIPGSIYPCSWSRDAGRILLCQIYQAQYQLYSYDVNTQQALKLDHPAGSLGLFDGGYFRPEGEIWTTWEDAAHPSCLIALDDQTGEFKRVVLQADEA